MENGHQTSKLSIDELVFLRARVAELESSDAAYKAMVTALRGSEERFRALFDHSREWVYIHNFEGRFIDANQAILHGLGYTREDIPRLNFASLVDQNQRSKAMQAIKDVAQAGFAEKVFEFSMLRKDGKFLDVEVSGTIVYHDGQPHAILGIARDVTEQKRNIDRLRSSMGAIIRAMAVAVEQRDPYAAGHHKRVADLARSIATEMNLSKDQIEGIRMAGSIHDIGKLSIPSEILSKPTKLTSFDLAMLRSHAQAGYDIVKDIEFPWPIARTILEHHERMDGSGYPRGIGADDIMLEARIMAIADVVEAMLSHRPYRPAMEFDSVIDEITHNKGTLYDPEGVDACLRLFREKEYKLVEI